MFETLPTHGIGSAFGDHQVIRLAVDDRQQKVHDIIFNSDFGNSRKVLRRCSMTLIAAPAFVLHTRRTGKVLLKNLHPFFVSIAHSASIASGCVPRY